METEKPKVKPAAVAANAQKSPIALREEEILAFWQKEKIFEKTNEQRVGSPEFVFYDGPPFATGTPHYGHLIGGTLKDAIPRYQVMRGRHVRRQWGWDCHGLPLENLIEKELGLKTKKDIEDLGVGKFNAAAREAVFRYESEWKKVVPRLGRFVDMEHPYATMDAPYTESIWWIFKNLFDRELIYKGYKAMHVCPRCETTLANFEVNQGYKDITDLSAFVKFEKSDEAGTFFLAWTTTPWTLPGNAALAVNPEVEYVKIGVGAEKYILAKDRLAAITAMPAMKDKQFEVLAEMKGSELVGAAYKPVFDYYKNAKFTHPDRAWKVYGAAFVTTTNGTGIVHIAPAFGSDDLELARQYHIPPIHHVGMNGRFKNEVGDGLAGMLVKPKGGIGADGKPEKDAHQKTDVEIIKLLAAKGALFAKEKIIHSYPHCWRCETPLLNYATTSWFVKVSGLKDKLLAENAKVKWVPESIGEFRFGNWIAGSPDWAISRARYWGAPLPVWMCEDLETIEVVGSLEDMKNKTRSANRFFLVRHGEAENNIKNIVSVHASAPHHLTDKGREEAAVSGKNLADKKIDVILSSPFIRTRETAEIIADQIGFDKSKIVFDERLGEIFATSFDGKSVEEYHASLHEHRHHFAQVPAGCEGYKDLKKRMGAFIYDVDKKYEGKNVLIVSHDSPIWLLTAAAEGLTEHQSLKLRGETRFFSDNAQVRELKFAPIPHNENYELDFHRPFIDDVEYVSKTGKKMRRIPDVFDCWFESGSMPYGQYHYMGADTDPKVLATFDPAPADGSAPKGFPADFIAEGLDQTRGWFYSLLVLGVALFGKSPFKSVVVNGLILAEDGQKMSKSKQNFPDPMDVVNQYGADAVRYYLLASPAVHADDFSFSAKGVDEVLKKHIQRTQNVCAFYEMYSAEGDSDAADLGRPDSKNVLDQWMLGRLDETIAGITLHLDAYETDKATRFIADFVDDLSTWYVRRSRDRYKAAGAEERSDKLSALRTTRYALLQFAKLIAPFMPFLAEDLYQRLKGGKQSVHLEDWPTAMPVDEKLIKLMAETRKTVTSGLEARAKAGIKVRQPLAKLSIKSEALKGNPEFLPLVQDEVNVKEIAFDANLATDVLLDTVLTEALKEEGDLRDLIRAIQEARKNANLDARDKADLVAAVGEKSAAIIKKFESEIMATCGLSSIKTEPKSGEAEAFRFA